MPKSHLDDMPEFRYYILSLKWSPGLPDGQAVWWGPDNNGYTTDLMQAGRYTREQVEAKPGYYNDGVEALAVCENIAITESRMVRLVKYPGSDWWRERIQPKETTDDSDG